MPNARPPWKLDGTLGKLARTLFLATVVLSASLLHAQEADLLVTKSGPAEALPDTDVAYDIGLTNLGPDPAVLVELTDSIPAGMTFVSATQNDGTPLSCSEPSPGDTSGTITCNAQVMAQGDSANFTFVFHIPSGTPPGTFFTNTASVSSAADPNEENNSASVATTTPLPPSGDMSVEKFGPAGAAADSDVVYTIMITNAGPDDATQVSVEDILPGTMTFVSIVQNDGPPLACTDPGSGNGGTVTCTAALFPANSSATFTLTTHVPAGTPSGTTFENTVGVTSNNDPNEENNVSSTLLVISSADVGVVKTGPANATAGDDLSYTITLSNAGPDAASNVELSDQLPPNTTFVSLTQNTGVPAACAAPAIGTNGLVTCNIIGFGQGASASFTLVVKVGNTTSVSNTANVTTDSIDTNQPNNTSTVVTAITPSADLSVTKTGPPTATAGSGISYTVTAANNGPTNAFDVALTDSVPANTTLVSVTQNSGPAFACTPGATIMCTIPTFAPGATASFTFVMKVNSSEATGSSVVNTANITATTGDPDTSNNSSTTTAVVNTSADLSVSKSGPSTVNAGADISYTITLANPGPSDAAGVSLSDAVPANTTFVSMTQLTGPTFACSTPAVGGTGTVTCTLATLTANTNAVFQLVVHVQSSTANAATISNTATVTATTPDPGAGNNSSTANTAVTTSADLAVVKTGPAPPLTPDTDATYVVTVTNNGPSDAATATLSDILPANTTFVSEMQTTGPTFSCTTPAVGAGGAITCTIASLPAGAVASFTIVLHVQPQATGVIANPATVSSTTPDPNSANNTSINTTSVNPSADLSVTKSGPAAAFAGTDITYNVTVSNSGPSDAANVSLTDAVPANTTFVSATQTSGPTFACTTPAAGGTGTITCTIATLSAGATAAFTIVVHIAPQATGTISNTATVATTTADPASANNTATAATTTTASSDVVVEKTGPESVTPGANATYVVTVTNEGPSDAASVTMTDVLPADTTFVSETQTSGPTFACTTPAVGGTGTITCTIATLPAGTTASFTIVLRIGALTSGTVSNTATVTTPSDPAPANNSSTTAAAVVAPGIPTLSTWGLALLAFALAAIVLLKR